MPVTDFEALLGVLIDAKVDFLIVGGVAAIAHGAARLTQDIDIVYERSRENLDRIVTALEPQNPYLRGVPPGLPFDWSTETLERGLNFTLTTELGDIDLLGEITGGGNYEQLAGTSVGMRLFGLECQFLDLEALIRTKRAAGRPKDLEALAELEALLDESE